MPQVKSRATEPAGLDATGSLTRSLTKSAGRNGLPDRTPRTCARIVSPSVDWSEILIPDRLTSSVEHTVRHISRSSYSTSHIRTVARGVAVAPPRHENGVRSRPTAKLTAQ